MFHNYELKIKYGIRVYGGLIQPLKGRTGARSREVEQQDPGSVLGPHLFFFYLTINNLHCFKYVILYLIES